MSKKMVHKKLGNKRKIRSKFTVIVIVIVLFLMMIALLFFSQREVIKLDHIIVLVTGNSVLVHDVPTPDNATTTRNTSVIINVSIAGINISQIIWNWNGTNYTLMNDSLFVFYNFDNRSSLGENDTLAVDLSGYGNNASCAGTACPTWTNQGKYRGSFNFDGNGDNFNRTLTGTLRTDFTLSFWLNSSQVPNNQRRIVELAQAETVGFQITMDTLGTITIDNTGPTSNIFSGIKVNDSNWHHVTTIRNGSNYSLYVDSILQNSSTGSIHNYTRLFMGIHSNTSTGLNYSGDIDEFYLWNRSLTVTEVYQLYATNLYKYNSTQWYLTVNQSKNAMTGLEGGTYTYLTYAQDTAGNLNRTEVRTLIILSDAIKPNVTINSPENQTYSTTTISFNVTSTDEVGMSMCLYTLTNGATNFTMNNASTSPTQWTASNTTMAQGSHTVRFYCNDTNNNLNNSGLVNFNVNSGVTLPSGGSGGNGGGGSGGSGGASTNPNDTIELLPDEPPEEIIPSYYDEEGNPIELNYSLETRRKGVSENCIKDWQCGEWGTCNAFYTLDDLVKETFNLKGVEERTCIDKNGCFYNRREQRLCSPKISITTKKVNVCSKDYVEIYDAKGELISRLELMKETENKRLNVQFAVKNTLDCYYCYNGVRDFDEEGVDCGPSCASCVETPNLIVYKFPWWILIETVLICIALSIFLYLRKENNLPVKKN